MKKSLLAVVTLLGIASLLAACSAVSGDQRIQPTEGKLTFVFFYTEG